MPLANHLPLHPSLPLFLTSILFSILLTISSNSWFIAWIGLEINLISFLPIMISKNNKYSSESALKYFLIQAMASSLIIISTALAPLHEVQPLITIALLLKIGAAPVHQWLPSVVDGLSWTGLSTLLSVQKVNPFILISIIPKTQSLTTMLYLHMTMSAIVGAIGGLSQLSLRKVLAFSSIAHTAWLLSSINISDWVWSSYFLMYTLIMFSVVYTFWSLQMSSINQIMASTQPKSTIMLTIPLLSLGGLPPFTGFVPKLIIIQTLMDTQSSFSLLILLSSTFISLFFYIRLTISNMLMSNSTNTLTLTQMKVQFPLLSINLVGLLIPPLMLLLL
uniref:NADH-ubiquinone oxidoreductase chain 2 n=1 Tax=Alicella gigantea TaxID=1315966 RepID=A0A5B7KSP7_9CRUS|nr:NADH dehydrogenase subunit 2 [Alicella gigantea]QAT19471.1 NADH dehydrogenase subunit 2 [Alicella gigantea]